MVFNYRIYLTSATACIGGLLFGYDTGFIGSAVQIKSFQRDFGMNADNSANIKGNIVATLQAGCFFGTLLMAWFTAKFGRRYGMGCASLVFVIGAILQTVTTNELALLYTGRAIAGLGVGAASMLAPTYVSEVAPKEIRGRLSTAYGFSIFFGIMISYWIDYGCEQGLDPEGHNQWRIPVALQLVPGVLLAVGGWFIKESPRWLIKKDRRDEALVNLAYIRMVEVDDEAVLNEYHSICLSTDEELRVSKGVSITEMFAKRNRMRVLIGFIVMVCQQFSGTNAFTYYAPLLFSEMGLSGTSASLFATGVYGIVKCVSSMIFLLFLVDKVGRRTPMVIGAFCMGVFLLIMGVVMGTHPPDPSLTHPAPASLAMIVMVYFFCISYSMSWGPVPFTFVSEIYPNRIREYCVAMGLATQWAFNYCISRIVPLAMANIGWKTFLMFAIFNFSICIFTFFVVRETAGISLERMEDLFSNGFLMSPKQWPLNGKAIIVGHAEDDVELERQTSILKASDNKFIENRRLSSEY
ncbi:general substrate transporter [Lipomyces arxii]|uniref:general substrate transporter n=1 Tax=Lipomyces arxii TaxID=56418 RepID=UPI0034CF4FC3